ncbi:MAG: NAD/NADP octopine/nopaline dehydrogenase family protein [Dehalococcoidales bacterium]|nr:NAD/NADP octopine/nopaline dehydrogenase family protein [Dehalococcoidales bacterium]
MDASRVLRKPVAVLGGGACGQAFAADFTLAGHKVRLYELPEFAPTTLKEVLITHEIEFGGAQDNCKWFRRAGLAKVDVVTTEISEALKGAGLVIVAIPAKGHEPFFERMIPYLEDGQIVSIFPDNFGSLMLRNMMRGNGCTSDIIVGGWSSMPYVVRAMGVGKLDCMIRARELIGDTLPSRDGDTFLRVLKEIPAFDGTMAIKRGDTIIGVDLSNPNPAVHVPGSVLNVGAMEISGMGGTLDIPKGKYSMYKHGMSPAVSQVQFSFYQEERRIAQVMGIEMSEYCEDQFFWKGSIMGVEFWAPFADVNLPPVVGPDSTEHRYFTEDISVGTVIRYHLGKKLGIDLPVIESLIRLGSVICRRDFLKDGLSLRELGIEDMTVDQMMAYLRGI